jgi:hypothetical protein
LFLQSICRKATFPCESPAITHRESNRRHGTSYPQALICRHCSTPVIVEVTTKIYNLEPYVEDEKVEHGHPENPDTICDALDRVATDVRLLDKWDPNDYEYLVRRGETGN